MSKENPGFGKPEKTIRQSGSVIELYNFQEILNDARNGRVRVYDRADFNTPIERAYVFVENASLLSGEIGVSYTAFIDMDRSRNDTQELHQRIIRKLNEKIRYSYKFGDNFTVSHTAFHNVFKLSSEKGSKFLVWADPRQNFVCISNNLSLSGQASSGEITEVAVVPPAENTVDQQEVFSNFLQGLVSVADLTAGSIDRYNLDNIQLRRTYKIGLEKTMTRPDIKGEQPTKEPITQDQSKQKTSPLESEFEVVSGEISLDDIGGLHEVKKQLKDIAVSFKHPDIMDKWGASRPQGILLFGEPGTGKTMLVKALASEIGAKVWEMRGGDLYDKWLGESEKKIKEIFDRARETKEPLIIFFDEFESIIGITAEPSAGGADNARNAVAGIFKQEMNTLAKENPNVLIAAATNYVDRVDQSLIRSGRFDHKVYVPMPDQEARQEIIAGIITRTMVKTDNDEFRSFAIDLNIPELASVTDGMSGADLTEIFRRICFEKAMHEARGNKVDPITQEEIETAIIKFKTNG